MKRKFTLAQDIENLAADFKEDYAAKVLKFSKVKELITEAATHGYDGVRIAQKLPLTLRNTKAGKGLEKALEASFYKLSWVDAATGMEGYSADITKAVQYRELIIYWGNSKGHVLHKPKLPEEEND